MYAQAMGGGYGEGGRVWNPWAGTYNETTGSYSGEWMDLNNPETQIFLNNKGHDPRVIIQRDNAQGGCPPGVDCDYINRAANEGLSATASSVGVVESNYSIWESNYDHLKYPTIAGRMKTIYKPDGRYRSARAAQFAMYSRTAKGVGLGLSVLSVGLGAYQMRQQSNDGQAIDPINASQVGVGSVGLFAAALNAAGIGVRLTGPISASAGIFGMVLSIPSNWYNVYKGAYDLQYASTPYYPSDSEVFGGN
jgi:hypothetical protein